MLVILIGFIYTHNKSGYRELVGNYADLYHLYSYFSQMTDNIHVMTDLKKLEDSDKLIQHLKSKTLPEELFSLQKSSKFMVYESIEDLNKLLSLSDEEVFVYFSGHCFNGKLILPDGTLETLSFRRKLESFNVGAEIFLLFDCCHADGTKLPWVWNGSEYMPSEFLAFTCRQTICLCSTKREEYSASKNSGSVFTRCFLNQISGNKEQNLSALLDNINRECECYPQTATLYCSMKNTKIWSWLYKRNEELGDSSEQEEFSDSEKNSSK